MPEANDTRCEGYVNYATFTVAVLLQNNDRSTFEQWQERAKELQEEYPETQVEGGFSGACIQLSDEIKKWIENNVPETLLATPVKTSADQLMNDILSGLLEAAMDQVDWREVAEDFLTD